MRRILLVGMCLLEMVAAILLVQLGLAFPERATVEDSFQKAQAVTGQTRKQIEQIRDQVKSIEQPKLRQVATGLQTELSRLTGLLKDQQIDVETLVSLRNALGTMSSGLESFSTALDSSALDKLGESLDKTAAYLEEDLVPAASSAADKLEESTGEMAKEAKLLTKYLQQANFDLKAVQEMHDGLEKFGNGLDKMKSTLQVERLKTMRDGFQGMDQALSTGAGQVERLAGFTYPVLTFEGFKPYVEQRQFWPQGGEIAEGLRKASKGVQAAEGQMGELVKNLPEFRQALEGSEKVVAATRETLAAALKHQAEADKLLKQLPEHTAKLGETLPKTALDLAKILRDAKRFQEVASSLRKAKDSLQETAKNWPDLQKTMRASATLLRGTQKQLDDALKQEKDYKNSLEQTSRLVQTFAEVLPPLTESMLLQLDQQEKALDDLSRNLGEVGQSMPVYEHSAGQVVETGRLLAWLVAALVLVHGLYLVTYLAPHRRQEDPESVCFPVAKRMPRE